MRAFSKGIARATFLGSALRSPASPRALSARHRPARQKVQDSSRASAGLHSRTSLTMSLAAVHSFLAWFQQKGGYVHPSAEVRDGMSSSLPFPPRGLLLTRQTRRAGSGCTPRRRSRRTRCSSRARARWPCRRRRRAARCRRSTPRGSLTGGARACSSRRTSACTGCTRSGRRASECAVIFASCCALFCTKERRGSRSRAS